MQTFRVQSWNRWQDGAPLLIGALLFFTPLVFSIAAIGSHVLSAWILAAAVGMAAISLALLWVGFPRNQVIVGMTVLVGMMLFIVPWALGASWFTASAWVSSIMGMLLIIAAGGVAVDIRARQIALPNYQARRADKIESNIPNRYRRASPSPPNV